MKVWLCDLTYTQQSISSDAIPYAIGGIASYLNAKSNFNLELKVIKYPEDLTKKIEEIANGQIEPPEFIGFSNYLWNFNISYKYASLIKRLNFKKYPKIIFGGPNFPIEEIEQFQFLKKQPYIDYYIAKEGEGAWLELITYFDLHRNLDNEEELLENVCNLVFISKSGKLKASAIGRIKDITELPSPYKAGILDEYLDGRLLPTIQTNRGCPFTCTFCTEGQSIWSRITKKKVEVVNAEIDYIYAKMMELEPDKRRYDLLITDSNFGMYPEDIEISKHISKLQKKSGWPKYINVATGKNNKERVLEAAKILNGALSLAGSVQSLDKNILENIKRKNISVEQILKLAESSVEIGANSYSEVILGLPGDSKETHLASVKTLIDSSFNFVVLYQMMLLPGTEMSSIQSVKKYNFKSKYRVIPRAFGYYECAGKLLSTGDIEEIVIETNTLSFQDYIYCREITLIINIFYNDSVFYALKNLISSLNLSVYDWLLKIHSLKEQNDSFLKLINQYINETNNELWDSKEHLLEYLSEPKNVDKYISGELGSNLMYKYKARSVINYLDTLYVVIKQATKEFIQNSFAISISKENTNLINSLIEDLATHNLNRMKNLFNPSTNEININYSNDISYWLEEKKVSTGYFDSINDLILHLNKTNNNSFRVCYFHSQEQKDTIGSYKNIFGDSEAGISRILSRIFLKQSFKNYKLFNSSIKSKKYQQIIDKRLMQT